ncbi:microviridin/marinostatin family tricyclic proteinase inhibitor [Chryseobacterium sp. Tr-659]|uniref:microviridin/marinostatin family tricyclic proteinase inhibitor n=1 Tax=Chryseobacterium sp. Tr-659 TaxID=2608340 RepID=UPI001420A4E0|nr:microviridin/marinostatin family tricyclic proteinase inhibitor [Chryseobacterium sp. Tr-659]NIF04535.1 microviridin/marinostatin family tricyclic proteinase inhibitor [Chryseobacterium sp. Tr-659]
MKSNNSKKKPFFASFLEKQVKDPETVKGGSDITLLERDLITKPAIDVVTSPKDDMMHTLKYPSDGDDDVITIPL